MLTRSELRTIAQARLSDARALNRARRYDGAVYICGYAVEVALKARICRTLKWPGFPELQSEFNGLTSLKTHNLDGLLRLSGHEDRIRINFGIQWSAVVNWGPESRYSRIGVRTAANAQAMIVAATDLVRELCRS